MNTQAGEGLLPVTDFICYVESAKTELGSLEQ